MTVRERKDNLEQFEVFELVDAIDKDDKAVQIKQVSRTVTMIQIDKQITRYADELAEWQGYKDEIIALNS